MLFKNSRSNLLVHSRRRLRRQQKCFRLCSKPSVVLSSHEVTVVMATVISIGLTPTSVNVMTPLPLLGPTILEVTTRDQILLLLALFVMINALHLSSAQHPPDHPAKQTNALILVHQPPLVVPPSVDRDTWSGIILAALPISPRHLYSCPLQRLLRVPLRRRPFSPPPHWLPSAMCPIRSTLFHPPTPQLVLHHSSRDQLWLKHPSPRDAMFSSAQLSLMILSTLHPRCPLANQRPQSLPTMTLS